MVPKYVEMERKDNTAIEYFISELKGNATI